MIEIYRSANKFLWDASNWPFHPLLLIKNPLGPWAPYMEIVGDNVSLFSKGSSGRHPLLSPIEQVPVGVDIGVATLAAGITQVVRETINETNASPEFAVPFHVMSAKLGGGPVFSPKEGNIQFVVEVYRKDEGGDTPVEEWHLDLSAKLQIVAVFRESGTGGYFDLSQVGGLRDISGSFTWKFTGLTFGIDENRLPDFARNFIDQFGQVSVPNLEPVGVSVDGAESISCEVRSDRVVLWISMMK
jgi:hypothetical protein